MDRRTFDPLETLSRNWQVLLIASLPGSLLRIWAVLSAPDGVAGTPGANALPLIARLWLWSATHGLATLLTFPVCTVVALLVFEAYREKLPDLAGLMRTDAPEAPKPLRLDALSTSARELLAAVSARGEFRLVPRLGGAAVVAVGTGRDDDREFHNAADREVAQRYRYALAELERAGVVERDGETRRLTTLGWPAARLLTRQELDRIAVRTRHLTEAEQRLLRLLANCREQYKVSKIVLRRDGSSMSAVYGNGLTVHVPDICPLDETFPDQSGETTARFEDLATGIPEDYLTLLPERRLGNPLVLRVPETGLRYLRFAEVAYAGGSGTARPAPGARVRPLTSVPAMASVARTG
jgi:hypothetical protein